MMKSLMILSLFFFLSCENRKKENINSVELSQLRMSYHDKNEINRLLLLSLNKGDFVAFNKVSSIFFLNEDIQNIYYYSQIMANKYNCPEAYYNLYHVLTTKVRIDDIIMYSEDKFTKSLAKYYILKSYELGFRGAKIDVELLFGKTNIPRSCEFIVFTSDK